MASTYKTFLNDDVVTTRTLLHEAIPITGSIVYGTYGLDTNSTSEKHVKKFAHGMFQSVYDYPYLSSSANHIFDIAYGHHSTHANSTNSTAHPYNAKRKNIYNQMAQILVGHSTTGDILQFDADGDLIAGGVKYGSCIFFNFSRLLSKDEIKKGSFEIQFGVHSEYEGWDGSTGSRPRDVGTTLGQAAAMHTKLLTIKDDGAATDYRVNSPAGEYGILKITSDATSNNPSGDYASEDRKRCGLIYYQAGIVVLTTDVFVKYLASGGAVDPLNEGTYATPSGRLAMTINTESSGTDHTPIVYSTDGPGSGDTFTLDHAIRTASSATDEFTDAQMNDLVLTAIRKRIAKVCFNNTTELNSTIYFCRINHNDFNYSSNPTYLSSSQIRVKNTQSDAPVSYITTVGLYSSDNEMLAVAKLSEPLRKDPTNDVTLRVRLDY